jgi:hypothetical protein
VHASWILTLAPFDFFAMKMIIDKPFDNVKVLCYNQSMNENLIWVFGDEASKQKAEIKKLYENGARFVGKDDLQFLGNSPYEEIKMHIGYAPVKKEELPKCALLDGADNDGIEKRLCRYLEQYKVRTTRDAKVAEGVINAAEIKKAKIALKTPTIKEQL